MQKQRRGLEVALTEPVCYSLECVEPMEVAGEDVPHAFLTVSARESRGLDPYNSFEVNVGSEAASEVFRGWR